jgi:hypothetical protein
MTSKCEKRSLHLRVPVLKEEAVAIRALAKAAGLPVATYLRKVGMGCQLQAVIDHGRIRELSTMHADLRRLGGLLALWLQDDARTRGFSQETIQAALGRIDETRCAMHATLRELSGPATQRRL